MYGRRSYRRTLYLHKNICKTRYVCSLLGLQDWELIHSHRPVTLVGSLLFILFGLIYLYEAFRGSDSDPVAEFNPLT